MKNTLMTRLINQVRWLVPAVRFSLALLPVALMVTAAHAQISIQDGNPLAIVNLGGGPTVNAPFTVTPNASVLVVIVEDRQGGTIIPEPTTITWNGTNTLTQDTNSLANSSNYRSMAVYHLFNPPAGSGNITVAYSAGNNTILVSAFTLNGVDTNAVPIILQANNNGSVSSLSGVATGVTVGSWAVVGSIWGNTGNTLTTTGTGGTATMVVNNNVGGSSATAGYVANLSSGSVTVGVSNSGSTKGCFIAEIFAPGTPAPPSITAQPKSLNVFTNSTVRFTAIASGAPPLSYQWYTNNSSSALSDGGNLVGSTSNVLTIANANMANAADYTVVITNIAGAVTSSVANLTFITPSGAYEAAMTTNSPLAFYTFSETSDPSTGAVVANDSAGSFSGTYGTSAQNAFNGILGPQATADGLVGFPDGNTALGTVGAANSFVTLPAFNLGNGAGTNTLTITTWIKPQGAQAASSGIVFCRAGSTVAGLGFLANGSSHLGYTWNNDAATYNWDSGLVPPAGVWSMVSLAVTPTNATIYLFNTNGFLSATHAYTHVAQKFDGPTLIGEDSLSSARTFNGSIDEMALFGQSLTANQLLTLFSAASGVSAFPPSIGSDPRWTPASVYIGQSAGITVSATGTAPLSYQWMAAPTNGGSYVILANGGNISGATSATLTITNAQLTNYLNYVVRVSNTYGAVTSTAPATLTVLPFGPAMNFTLNYGGNPIVQGIGADWDSVNSWNPDGLSASASAYGNPGSSYELVVGSLMRNPANTTYNIFPGDSLIVDGDGAFENGTINGIGEIRFKNGVSTATTNYFKNLVLNGGMLNIGDSTDVILQGKLTVATNSSFGTLGGSGTHQTYQVDSYLTGSGTILLYLTNSNPSASLPLASVNITGATNTFTGQWDVEQGPLLGSGNNSLGTNTITIGTNGILETAYPINNPNSWLVLNGGAQVFLTQNDTFQLLFINGIPLAAGTYSAATLSANYPANFPATFPAVSGASATTASGQITVLTNTLPVGIAIQPASIRAITNTTATFSVEATGYPINYQWYQIVDGVTNLIGGATGSTYTTAAVQDSDSGTGYFVVVSNQNNVVTSSTAILTAGHMVLSAGYLRNDQYSASILNDTVGTATLTSQLFPGSTWPDSHPASEIEYLTTFDSDQDLSVTNGQRIYGWFKPAVSGDYIFFVTTDDAGSLWLSTDNSPANAYEIAQNQQWMVDRDWTCANTNCNEHVNYFSSGEWRSDLFISGGGQSAFADNIYGWSAYPGFNDGDGGIPLVGGTKYYIELDNYQNGGGQCAAVTYKLAGDADPSSNSPSLFTGNNIFASVPDTVLPQPNPIIGSIKISGSNVILSGSNGLVNATYNVLATTNLSLPLANWPVAATHQFDGIGNFNTTNAIIPGAPQTFYRLQQIQ